MICPTDFLESIIRTRFEGQKYFYTSLGNTMSVDKNTYEQIAALIKKHDIEEVSFILSEDNPIVADAINKQEFLNIRGLSEDYNAFNTQKEQVVHLWEMRNQHAMLLSYHLNQKIKELKAGLHGLLEVHPKITGRLFSKHYNDFRKIHSHLTCITPHVLN